MTAHHLGEALPMNEERQQERRQALVIILVALVVAIACWAPIGWRMFSQQPLPSPPHSERVRE